MSEILIHGFLLSGLYALIAIGFTLIFSVCRVLNLAYGTYLMLGGYTYFYVVQMLDGSKIIGVALAIAIGGLSGVLIYTLLIKRLRGNQVAIEISTLILAVVIQSVIILLFNNSSKIMLPIIDGILKIGDTTVTYNILFAVICSWLVLSVLLFCIKLTRMGRAIQAVSMDMKGAIISGINIEKINLATWALSGALGALAGVFFASYTQLNPTMWIAPLIIAIAVVIVGGIGSIMGSLIVAHIIGFTETLSTTLISAELRGVFTMLLIIGVLIVTPKGLFGRDEL